MIRLIGSWKKLSIKYEIFHSKSQRDNAIGNKEDNIDKKKNELINQNSTKTANLIRMTLGYNSYFLESA